MTTNQAIDGVPRDYVLRLTPEAHSVLLGMVEHCLNVRACMGMDEGFKDFDTEEEHDFVKELRALLDAPEALVVPLTGPKEWLDSLRPAAQPQGEPVAWQLTMNGEQKEIAGRIGPSPYWENLKRHGYKVEPLYAEQPAPVAVEYYQNKINHLKQLLRNVRATPHFTPEDVLAIDATLREDGE